MATKIPNGLDLNSTKGINCATPTASTDVANKSYVDTAVGIGRVNITANVPATTTTVTAIKSLVIPANSCQVGTTFRVTVYGTLTTTASTAAINLYWGTLGTTGDTLISGTSPLVSATTTFANWRAEYIVTVRTLNTSTGTVQVNGSIAAGSATGATPLMAVGASTSTATLNTTTAINNLTVAYKGGTASTIGVQQCVIEQV